MRRWGAVFAIGFMVFMFTVDMTIVALALPAMGETFQQTDEALSAVLLSYTIPLTLLMIPAGMFVTRWKTLPTFVVGVSGFAIASVICALAPSYFMLLVGRVLQGVFGSLMSTLGVAVVAAAVEPHERGRAMGIIATVGPLGAIAGPGLGGLLLSIWDWPAIFLINVPVSLLAISLAFYTFPGISFGPPTRSGLSQMIYLLRHARFLAADLTLLVFAASFGALFYLLPFALQDVQQMNPALAGATLLVPSLGMAIMSPVGGYLADRFGARLLVPAGIALTMLGMLALWFSIAIPTSVWDLDWRLFVIGLGNGIAYGPLMTVLMGAGPRETLGAVSGLTGVTRQLGFIFGPLSVSLLWSWQVAASPADRISGSVLIMIALVLVSLVTGLLAVRGLPQSQTPVQQTPAQKPVPTGS